MTHDLVLVSREQPTYADVQDGCRSARTTAGLGDFDLIGELGVDPMTEVVADVSRGELLLQVFTPMHAPADTAERYARELGVQLPLDAESRCWLTSMAMSGQAGDAEILAVLGVARPIARSRHGFLVVNGEVARVDGIDPPPRLAVPQESPAPAQVAAQAGPDAEPVAERAAPDVFLEAFLAAPTAGDQGWTRVVSLLKRLLADHPELRPRLIEGDGSWHWFLPTDPTPASWPLVQQLGTTAPAGRWALTGAGFGTDRYTQVSAALDLDGADAERLLPHLLELVDDGLDYGLLHKWAPTEPTGPTGIRPGPRMRLSAQSLTQRLPDLYWAQVLGPPWVGLFGADRLAGAPAYRVEEVGPDHWLLQLTEHVADAIDDPTAFAGARDRVKRHLGADCFYDPDRGPYADYRAPSLPTLAERGIVVRSR